jgi:hypothetical protein
VVLQAQHTRVVDTSFAEMATFVLTLFSD